MTQALEVRGVSKEFGRPGRRVLSDIDLSVGYGEMVAIMGPSGSGKTTLLNLIGLLDEPTSGIVDLVGDSTSVVNRVAVAAVRGRHIGFVFQNANLLSGLNAIDNVAMGGLYLGWTRQARYSAALALLNEVGLDNRLTSYPRTLSGGEQQRVAIARALIGEKRLILCDEPTGNLDRQATTKVVHLLKERARAGPAVVVVTHDQEVANQADRVVILADGRLAG